MRIGLAALVVVLLVGCDESQTSRYSSTSEARSRQLFEKGWLPDILPESASGIVVTTYVDIGWCKGEFRIPSAEIDGFIASMTANPMPFEYDAWKDDLAGLAEEHRPVYYYRSDRAQYAFACNRSDERCEFWCG